MEYTRVSNSILYYVSQPKDFTLQGLLEILSPMFQTKYIISPRNRATILPPPLPPFRALINGGYSSLVARYLNESYVYSAPQAYAWFRGELKQETLELPEFLKSNFCLPYGRVHLGDVRSAEFGRYGNVLGAALKASYARGGFSTIIITIAYKRKSIYDHERARAPTSLCKQ